MRSLIATQKRRKESNLTPPVSLLCHLELHLRFNAPPVEGNGHGPVVQAVETHLRRTNREIRFAIAPDLNSAADTGANLPGSGALSQPDETHLSQEDTHAILRQILDSFHFIPFAFRLASTVGY